MKIRKAVITAAAPSQRDIPLQTLVDRDGQRKSVLALHIAEMTGAGAEQVCVVVFPGMEPLYRQSIGKDHEHVQFIAQPEPRGYGHALLQAQRWIGEEPFLHQVGDHLFVSGSDEGHAAQQVVSCAQKNACSVSGVRATRENLLPSFGAVGGQRFRGTSDVYTVDCVLEKPTPTEAEQSLLVPGLRAGNYLCFMGTHAFTPTVMDLLAKQFAFSPDAPLLLSPVLNTLAQHEKYLAQEAKGRRFHLDTRWGPLSAQIALGLSGSDRDAVLLTLADQLLAENSS